MVKDKIGKQMYKNPVILFRHERNSLEEYEIAKKYFPVYEHRTQCKKGDLVIGRFSVLPYYKELEKDVEQLGAIMFNTVHQHEYISSFNYYDKMIDLTPETWREYNFPYSTYEGPFVVKGCTNSRKHQWDTHMFAKTRTEAVIIANKLHNDMLLSEQDILYRKYIPLKNHGIGINGLPFSNEWRYFAIGGTLIDYGFYWSSLHRDVEDVHDEKREWLVNEILSRMSNSNIFYSFDIAETEDGNWILIEMNSGQMSGLSTINPDRFYYHLYNTVMELVS